MAGSSGVWLSVTPRVVNEMSVFRFADQRFGNCTFSAGVGVGHVSVRREAFDGVTLVVQQRAWPVGRRPEIRRPASQFADPIIYRLPKRA